MKHDHYGTEVNLGARSTALDFSDALNELQGHWLMVRSAATLRDVERGPEYSARSARAESRHVMRPGEDLATKRIGVVARHDDDLLDAVAGRQGAGHEVFVSDNMVNGLHDVLNSRHVWDVLFFKYEDFGTITSLFNFMRLFRLRCPSLPLVLVSTDFLRDDFSPERLALCDASLKLPTSPERLEAAIEAAHANNALWVERLNEYERQSATNWASE